MYESVLTIPGAQKFAITMFNYLNGKVNTRFLAKYLFFGSQDDSDIFGISIGDVVEVNLANIFSELQHNGDFTEDKVRGLIYYVVVHELLHLDQDFLAYYRMLPNEPAEVVMQVIENACHAQSYKIALEIYVYALANDFPELSNNMVIPFADLWINELQDAPRNLQMEILYQYRYSFYYVTNPIDKVIFYLSSFVPQHILEEIPKKFKYATISIRNVSGEMLAYDYIFYNSKWIQYDRIINAIRPILLVQHQNNKENSFLVDVQGSKIHIDDDTYLCAIECIIKTKTPNIDIVNQIMQR